MSSMKTLVEKYDFFVLCMACVAGPVAVVMVYFWFILVYFGDLR